MTNIRILYNPVTKKCEIFWEDRQITAKENKIHNFLETNDFFECLLPFSRRYMIWQGLLPELITEVNDDELQIVFEGKEEDFRQVEAAFRQTETIVSNLGYENRWQLSFEKNFGRENQNALLAELAGCLREMCESRAELREADMLLEKLKDGGDPSGCERELRRLAEKHQKKWEQSDSRYKEEKIAYIRGAVLERLARAEREFGTAD